MNSYLNYIMEVNIGLVVMLVLYLILLRDENDFTAKRIFLLSSIILTLLLPLIHIPFSTGLTDIIGNSLYIQLLPEITIGTDQSEGFRIWESVFLVYLMISLGLLLMMIWQLGRLTWFILHSRRTRSGNFQLIETAHEITAFSFFSIIIIGRGPFSSEEKNLIIKHESIHAQRLHSLDLLLLEVIIALFWFNPCVYVLRKIMRDIHEFEADALTVERESSLAYSRLVARTALGKTNFQFATHFNQSITLKRLIMLNTNHKKINSWKWTVSLVVACVLFVVVACQEQVKSSNDNSVKSDIAKNDVYSVVDEAATPIDGINSYYEFVASNLKYPDQARQMGIEGKVFVEFVVQKDGSITNLKVLKGIGAGCDKAAMEVIAKAPKWSPARNKGEVVAMYMVLPIVFKLG